MNPRPQPLTETVVSPSSAQAANAGSAVARLGPFRILAELGRGGMGAVYRAHDTRLDREVALKVLLPDLSADPKAKARFVREARAQAKVEHDHIIPIHEVEEADGIAYIVMPLLKGQTLGAALKQNPRPPLTEALRIAREIAEGLSAAHAVGLVHRDIKPANVWLEGAKRRVKILDFGLARTERDEPDNDNTGSTRAHSLHLTATGAIVGTPAYMSPEQALSQPTDPRSDIFSLGVLLYQLCAARRPFDGAHAFEVMAAITSSDPPSLRTLVPDAPVALDVLISHMLAKDPAARPQSAVAVGTELEALTAALIEVPMVVVPTEPSPWANLDSTIDDPEVHETSGTHNAPTDRTSKPISLVRPAKQFGARWMVAALVVLVAVAATMFVALLSNRPTGADSLPTLVNPPQIGPRKLIVSKTPGESTFPTLREALQRVQAGETIVITEPRVSEPALTFARGPRNEPPKDVTIESGLPNGAPAVLEFIAPPNVKFGTMFTSNNAEGLKLRNIEFDGKGVAEVGIQLSNIMPGALLENVTVRNVQKTGVQLWHAVAAENRPVVLDRVRVLQQPGGEAGLLLLSNESLVTKHVTVRNCRFEGPGRAAIRFDGPFADIEVSNCRIFGPATAAASFVRPHGQTSRGTFANNTVYRAPLGLNFESQPGEGRYELKVSHNYFAHTGQAGALTAPKAQGPVPGLTTEHNRCDPNSQPGILTGTSKLDAPQLPEPKPDDNATFLRFPADKFPTAGANFRRIGAQ